MRQAYLYLWCVFFEIGKAASLPCAKTLLFFFFTVFSFLWCFSVAVDGILLTQGDDLFGDAGTGAFKVTHGVINPGGNAVHFRGAESAGGDGGGAQADAACDKRTARVAGDGVLVGSDVYGIQAALCR